MKRAANHSNQQPASNYPHSWRKLARYLVAFHLALLAAFITSPWPLAAAEPTATDSPRCGYAPLSPLKYRSKYSHFDYVNENAPKGGTLRIGRTGHFDSLNFLRYPGTTIADRSQMPLEITAYLFDSLLTQSADEPAAWYCLVAASVTVSKDLQQVTFTLREDARFHDGTPLTGKDLLFTFNTLKRQGPPFYRQVLRHVTVKENEDASLTYSNSRLGDRNFVGLVGTLPIHPAHFWSEEKLTSRSMILPLGSGPYKLTSADAGKRTTLERVKSYWARDHFTQRGRFNLDKIIIDYFRDDNSALESYKVHNQDLRQEFNTVTWSREYKTEALTKGRMIKDSIISKGPGTLTQLTFNQRRPLFQDRKIRKALALLYEFESANRILFHGLYQKGTNVYGSTPLAATAIPGDSERALLTPFLKSSDQEMKSALPQGVLSAPAPEFFTRQFTTRQRLREANRLLDEAGLKLEGNHRLDPKTGQPLKLSIVYLNQRHQRILLHYAESLKQAGITLDMPALEPATARKKVLDHEFDLTILQWNPQMMAGTSETLLWGSRLADVKGSYALAGVKDEALDAAITAINRARTYKEMTAATRAFDRLFNWQIHAIPLYRSNQHWVSYWANYDRPKNAAVYNFSLIDRLWQKPDQQSRRD